MKKVVDFTDEEMFFACIPPHDLGKLGDGVEPLYTTNIRVASERIKKNSLFKHKVYNTLMLHIEHFIY